MLIPGAVLDAPPDRAYRERLGFAEVIFQGPSVPKPSKLKRWREQSGEDFVFALHAPVRTLNDGAGGLELNETLKAGIAWTRAAALALDARFVVMSTDLRVSTGQRDRNRLRAVFEELHQGTRADVVWNAGGLWEPEDAVAFAERSDVLVAIDPSAVAAPDGPVVYARLTALGGRQRFSDDLLLTCIENLGGAAEAFLAVHARHALKSAGRVADLASDAQANAADE